MSPEDFSTFESKLHQLKSYPSHLLCLLRSLHVDINLSCSKFLRLLVKILQLYMDICSYSFLFYLHPFCKLKLLLNKILSLQSRCSVKFAVCVSFQWIGWNCRMHKQFLDALENTIIRIHGRQSRKCGYRRESILFQSSGKKRYFLFLIIQVVQF